ncbi:MAG: Uncharacterized protein JWR07_3095 [Nevskia sp.]|nr:Uncharacterized protein [Nevskia sp.]
MMVRSITRWSLVMGLVTGIGGCGGGSSATTGSSSGSDGSVGGGGSSAAVAQGCNWLYESDAQTANIEYPETHAVYWVAALPDSVPSGDHIEIAGLSASARYFSFEIYSESGTLESGLNDTDIFGETLPVSESVQAGKGYRVSVIYSLTTATSGTTLVANPAALSLRAPAHKFLLYRLYLPTSGAADAASLPALTYVARDGSSTALSTNPDQNSCATIRANIQQALTDGRDAGSSDDGSVAATPVPAVKPARMKIFRSSLGKFQNLGARYMYLKSNNSLGDMMIVRGKAPAYSGSGQTAQVRYWSICSDEFPAPHRVVACLADQEALIGADGYYNVIIADKAPAAGYQSEFDYLPWGQTAFGAPIYRQLLAAPTFTRSISGSNSSLDPGTAQGDYFPQTTYCSSAVFAANLGAGSAAVFNACKNTQGIGLVPDLG